MLLQDHLKELRRRAQEAIAKRTAQRIAVYKQKLSENLPSQIDLWRKRELRLVNAITGKSGVSVASLLVRACPDPPKENDPDTDDEESKHEDERKIDECKDDDIKVQQSSDPTIRVWTESDMRCNQALDISEKQRVRLQQQAMAMIQYCSAMSSRASAMLKFIKKECPEGRGDVITLFRRKYPHYGLRWITRDVCEKLCKLLACLPPLSLVNPTPPLIHLGIKEVATFTRWRKYYMTNGCFRPDRRGRFTAGFLLRHEDLKLALTQWLLGRLKRDINISDVRVIIRNTHACTHALTHSHTHTDA